MSDELEASISKGDLSALKEILNPVDINNLNGDYAPLHWAALQGKEEIVNYLIQSGASVDLVSGASKQNALMYAVASKNYHCVTLLLSNGANPNSQTKAPSPDPKVYGGTTPLMMASNLGLHEICKQLLNSGARVNIQSEAGWTALFWAVYQYSDPTDLTRHFAVIKLLMDYGADPNILNKDGGTALDEAKEKGFNHLIELFEK